RNQSMSDWIIRECRADEADAVLTMWREAGASPSVTDSAADIRRAILESPARFLVAESQGTLIGSVIGCFDGWRAKFFRDGRVARFSATRLGAGAGGGD